MAKRKAPVLTPEQRAAQIAAMTETMQNKTYDPVEMARRARIGHEKRRERKRLAETKYDHDEMSRRAQMDVAAKRKRAALKNVEAIRKIADDLERMFQI
jgi:hypothetical protein